MFYVFAPPVKKISASAYARRAGRCAVHCACEQLSSYWSIIVIISQMCRCDSSSIALYFTVRSFSIIKFRSPFFFATREVFILSSQSIISGLDTCYCSFDGLFFVYALGRPLWVLQGTVRRKSVVDSLFIYLFFIVCFPRPPLRGQERMTSDFLFFQYNREIAAKTRIVMLQTIAEYSEPHRIFCWSTIAIFVQPTIWHGLANVLGISSQCSRHFALPSYNYAAGDYAASDNYLSNSYLSLSCDKAPFRWWPNW